MGGAIFLVAPLVAMLVDLVVSIQTQSGPAGAISALLTMLVILWVVDWR